MQKQVKSFYCAVNSSRGTFAQCSTAVKILCFVHISCQCMRANSETSAHSLLISNSACWDYSRADFKKLNEILITAPWEDIIAASPTPDVALTNITDIINQSASTCIPFRILESKKSTSVDAKPWINLTLKKMIHKRRRLFAKWRRTQCRHHRLAYNCLRNKIQRYIKDRKNQYNQFVFSKLDSLSTSRPNFWKTVKDLFGKRSYSNAPLIRGDTVHYDMTSKANIFNEYFASISTASDSIQSKILPRFHRCTDLFIPLN